MQKQAQGDALLLLVDMRGADARDKAARGPAHTAGALLGIQPSTPLFLVFFLEMIISKIREYMQCNASHWVAQICDSSGGC